MLQDRTPEFPSHRLFGPSRLARTLTVAAVLAAVGCAHTIPLKPTVERPPEVAQASVAVGVFYSQEFREYKHSAWRGGDRWDFDLGPASVRLLDRAFPALFESVVPVVSRPPLPAGGPRLAAVIEPKIEQFDFGLPFLKTGPYSVSTIARKRGFPNMPDNLAHGLLVRPLTPAPLELASVAQSRLSEAGNAPAPRYVSKGRSPSGGSTRCAEDLVQPVRFSALFHVAQHNKRGERL